MAVNVFLSYNDDLVLFYFKKWLSEFPENLLLDLFTF
jgi:hypothetical protein